MMTLESVERRVEEEQEEETFWFAGGRQKAPELLG
jgi:hypothetical protein